MVHLGEKTCIPVTRDLISLMNITLAAGRFVLIHPCYNTIREMMKMDVITDEQLDDLETLVGQYEAGEIMSLEDDMLFFMYSLVELTCRLFVSDMEDALRIMAIYDVGASNEEYIRVRNRFLRQAEDFLHAVKDEFIANENFRILDEKFESLNSLG